MICPKCNSNIPNSTTACPYCGNNFSSFNNIPRQENDFFNTDPMPQYDYDPYCSTAVDPMPDRSTNFDPTNQYNDLMTIKNFAKKARVLLISGIAAIVLTIFGIGIFVSIAILISMVKIKIPYITTDLPPIERYNFERAKKEYTIAKILSFIPIAGIVLLIIRAFI